jgi:hypothetical protein
MLEALVWVFFELSIRPPAGQRVDGVINNNSGTKGEIIMAQATASKGIVRRDDALATQETSLAELNTSGSAAREQAEIQSAYLMAKRFPRDEEVCRERIINACKRLSFADEAYYAFPRGGNEVSGPSVVLAREAARLWGNIRFGLKVVRDDDESRTIKGTALDLETNAFSEFEDDFKKLIQRKDKDSNQTRWVTPDERDLRELTNRRGAILIRNCITSILPKDLIDAAVVAAEDTIAQFADKNKAETGKRILETFTTLFVSQAELEKYLGHTLTDLTKEEIVKLRGIASAMRAGVSKKEEFFNGATKTATETGNLDGSKMKTGNAEHYDDHKSNGEQTGNQPAQDKTQTTERPRGQKLF